ncbi:hypothetical protein CYY_001978 [Polysphondylium violaceum]|uniref:ATP-dependent RNA helicase n=1 Tax=Polysphondylium violaceum TaxID=133409 RepID=A0A8J4Q8H2_9MYCE|nr:hypothetical protein CYY_001978 [Polysphondylium violaceum]
MADDGLQLNIVYLNNAPKPPPRPVNNNNNNRGGNNRFNPRDKQDSNNRGGYDRNNSNSNNRFNKPQQQEKKKPLTYLEKRKIQEEKQKQLKQNKPAQHHRYQKPEDNADDGNDSSGTRQTQQQEKEREEENKTEIIKEKYREAEQVVEKDKFDRPVLPTFESKKLESSEVFSSMAFGSLSLSETLVKNLQGHMKLEKPTHIQEASIPPIMNGHDAMVKAETGSGKTLSYLIPIVQKLTEQRVNRADGCYSIVISPTRELCTQIFEVLQKLLKPFYWIVPGIIMGGEKRDSEKARLRKGINLLVATPGRLLDHLQHTKSFPTHNIRWLVLDEADRLLDLGFEKDVTSIINLLDEKKLRSSVRQNILVSATLNEGISRLASLSLHNPVYIGLDRAALDPASNPFNAATHAEMEMLHAPKQLEQYFVEVESKERLTSLVSFIKWKTAKTDQNKKEQASSKMIVFFSSCDSVDFHHYLFSTLKIDKERANKKRAKTNKKKLQQQKIQERLKALSEGNDDDNSDDDSGDEIFHSEDDSKTGLFNVPIFKLHGELDQQTRTKTFLEFKKSPNGILLTTDVSARGLDLPQVSWIIQYDACSDTKDYVHRIGRTARLGSSGCSLMFLLPSERDYVKHLNSFNLDIKEMKVTSILQSLFHTSEGQLKKTSKSSQLESLVHDLQIIFERFIIYDAKAKDMARAAYQSSLRAYATHKSDVKHIFHISHLHLGHVSKSFALRETPTELNKMSSGIKGAKAAKKGDEATLTKQTIEHKMKNYKSTSEFSDGLAGGVVKDKFAGTLLNIFKKPFKPREEGDESNGNNNSSNSKKRSFDNNKRSSSNSFDKNKKFKSK